MIILILFIISVIIAYIVMTKDDRKRTKNNKIQQNYQNNSSNKINSQNEKYNNKQTFDTIQKKEEFVKRMQEGKRRAAEERKKAAERAIQLEKERLEREYRNGYRDDMTGYEYEKYCADLFTYFGWNARTTKKSGDYGADVIATKDGIKIVAQCKKWKGSVGFDAVKEVFTAKTINKADYAIVITNSHFSKAAKQGAKDTGVILIRHPELEDLLENLHINEK